MTVQIVGGRDGRPPGGGGVGKIAGWLTLG